MMLLFLLLVSTLGFYNVGDTFRARCTVNEEICIIVSPSSIVRNPSLAPEMQMRTMHISPKQYGRNWTPVLSCQDCSLGI
jgi:hypothetical protein